MNKAFYITTPIYYVNSKPHTGHAYTTILCDFMKRYYQIRGFDVRFQTGTDEHGDKIFKSAQKEGIEPQELVNKNSQKFRDLLPVLKVRNDHFIRTTDTTHIENVQDLLQKVYDKGDIYKADYTGKYCFGCERYYGDDELVDGKCPDHQTEPEVIQETNYFFKMSKYWDDLKKHIEDHPNFIIPSGFKNEVIGLLNQEPQDLCISRPKSRLTWGIELPFDRDFVTYVWFDALINYLSGLGPAESDQFKQFWPEVRHVIAKDILKPHCIYWTTMLFSMGISLPKQVVIHGYWMMDDSKMSKSRGRQADPQDYCDEFTTDLYRYYLLRGMRFGKDAHFDRDQMIEMCNADLSNNLGNLYSRTIGMIKKNFSSTVPPMGKSGELEDSLIESFKHLPGKMSEAIGEFKTAQYIENILEFSNLINKYLDETKPWTLAKDETKKNELGTILRTTLEGIRVCYSWLWPVVPDKAELVLKEIGQDSAPEALIASVENWGTLEEGFVLPKKASGFPRIEVKQD